GGCYASEIVAHRRFVVPIPDGIPDITAAAFLISYATAHHALFGRAALQPGETVVITGAAGATGLAAVELAALRGAKVIACAGSDEKLVWTQKAGAAFGIDYTREHTAKRISELAPSGFHVLVDTVSGPLFGELLTVAAFNARICVVGATATGGAFAPVDPMALLGRELTVLGVSLGAHRDAFPQRFAEDVSELFGLLARGTLNPRVSHVLPFSEAGEALRLLTRRENRGQVVLPVGPRAASA